MNVNLITKRLQSLADSGITTSICYGPCGKNGVLFSVDVLTSKGDSFDIPFAAETLEKATMIAVKECFERGWWRGDVELFSTSNESHESVRLSTGAG